MYSRRGGYVKDDSYDDTDAGRGCLAAVFRPNAAFRYGGRAEAGRPCEPHLGGGLDAKEKPEPDDAAAAREGTKIEDKLPGQGGALRCWCWTLVACRYGGRSRATHADIGATGG